MSLLDDWEKAEKNKGYGQKTEFGREGQMIDTEHRRAFGLKCV